MVITRPASWLSMLLFFVFLTSGYPQRDGDLQTAQANLTVVSTSLDAPIQIAAQQAHSCLVTAGGGIKCWGTNSYGELGNGSYSDGLQPVQVIGLTSGVKEVAVGFYFTCVVLQTGKVKCWGDNQSGQLGDGTHNISNAPVDVINIDNIKTLSLGYDFACGVTETNEVKCWGAYPRPFPDLSEGVVDIATGYDFVCVLTTAGGVKCWGSLNGSSPTGLDSGVAEIAAKGYHACARLTNGTVKCWGTNYYGEVGVSGPSHVYTPTTVVGLSNVTGLELGDDHSCAILDQGQVKCWGKNDENQLGDGSFVNQSTPVQARTSAEVIMLAAGYYHTCGLLRNGWIQCWGNNTQGFLGGDSTSDQPVPQDVVWSGPAPVNVAASYGLTCAGKAGGGARCWGSNFYGQVGDGSTFNNRHTPVDVLGLSGNVKKMLPAGSYACAQMEDQSVMCWGLNDQGQLGDGTHTNRNQAVPFTSYAGRIADISTYLDVTFVLTDTGGVVSFGSTFAGLPTSGISALQKVAGLTTGGGVKTFYYLPSDVAGLSSGVVRFSIGGAICGVTDQVGLKCLGSNTYGEVGDGTLDPRASAVDVLGLTSGVKDVAAGDHHTCALLTGGTVKCWGDNSFGQLGNGTFESSLVPVDVLGLDQVIQITAGQGYTCALTESGKVKCWGSNRNGRLGILEDTRPVYLKGYGPTAWNYLPLVGQ